MEVFFSNNVSSSTCCLDKDESAHCIKVLRHHVGDEIFIINGNGTLFTCAIIDADPTCARARIIKEESDWGTHPYRLRLACCPTKNIDRYEWMAEKATELGLDEIVPIIGDHSERRVFKKERLERILLSASKQSLKGAIPIVAAPISVSDFIKANAASDAIRLICCCFEGEVPRLSIMEALKDARGKEIIILIGPEGDFSREEAALAIESGFVPVHLGPSRLRTETAALTAVEAVYLSMNC